MKFQRAWNLKISNLTIQYGILFKYLESGYSNQNPQSPTGIAGFHICECYGQAEIIRACTPPYPGQVYKLAKEKLGYLIPTEHIKVLHLHFWVLLMSVIKKMIDSEDLYMPGMWSAVAEI
jgi:hypothetical protein